MTDVYDIAELRERARLLKDIAAIEEHRARMLHYIVTDEKSAARWSDIDELRERAQLLEFIARTEKDQARWSDIDELRERAQLLLLIAKQEAAVA